MTKTFWQTVTLLATPVVMLGILPKAALAATFSLEEATVADINVIF